MQPKRSIKLTREQERDLDIEIRFIEGVVRRAPEFIEALQILGDDYTRRGRFADGLKLDEQLARLRPDDALVHYNLACSYSLTGQFASASTRCIARLTWVTAISNGWPKTPTSPRS